ncbi:hypothetical protein FJT64_016521 [Amphibalanus amphitrite]|uniref:Cuticle protein n=1 Tax=Amphibalanus amphitrite TaxID=1232801 RepID=A0A6A4X0H9_AMPAM|nr:hypothetical protein FJT64_016521 [Amphibalanus amphitrite]
MKAFVIAALAVVASAAPGNYAALRSAALPIGLGAIAAPAVEHKTIKVEKVEGVPVTTYAAPAYGYGYAAPAYGYGYAGFAPAAVAVKAAAPAEVKTIKIDEAKPVALSYAAPAYGYGYAAPAHGYAPAPVAVKAVAPAEVKTIKVENVKPVAYAAAPAVAYSAPTVVRQEVEIPVTKTVHYADEQVVTGHTTNIIKPAIAAPAIAAPRTLVGKTVTNPATVSVRKYAAEVKTVNPVPAPYDVPYDVPQPYAVPTPVHTAPVEVRKRVYAAPAYAAPAYTSVVAAPAAVAVKAAPVEVKAW